MHSAKRLIVSALAFLFLTFLPALAADTLPDRLSDDDFWKLSWALSEANGEFQSENLLSNETDFPYVMASLQRLVNANGVYLGVGPEQNFNYIAATRPKIAFIIDIRRQNVLEHLMYKAIFELSPDRASFMSRLFSRQQPSGLTGTLTAAELFDAYSDVPGDDALFQKNLKEVESLLYATHRFAISKEERLSLAKVYAAFREFGPLIDYNSRGGGPSGRAFSPSYSELMTETDSAGREWSYLASEKNYQAVRDLELRNLLVPLTGDFGGPKAIRAVGQYLRDHEAVVSAFYTSNVEGYLFRGGDRQGNPNGGAGQFYDNVATLPLSDSSTFIRWIPGRTGNGVSIALAPIRETIGDFNTGRFTSADLNPSRDFGRGRNFLRRAERSVWVVRLRLFMYASWAAAAFVVRFFFWKPDDRRRRTVYSMIWAAAGAGIALALVAAFRL